jgi:hypothetical protein
MNTIGNDPRHHDIHILYSSLEHHRTLPHWNMQSLDLTDERLFSKTYLIRASDIVSKTMKLDAEGFVYLISDMLEEPDFQKLLNHQT